MITAVKMRSYINGNIS